VKLTKYLIIVAAMAWSSASAALYTLNNGSGSTATGIQMPDGSTFRSGTTAGTPFPTGGGISAGPGVVAFGTFDVESFAGVTSATQLVALFDQFGSATVEFNAAGPTGVRSVFSSAQTETLAGSTLAGDEIFLFAGNGTTLLNSTHFVIVKTTFTFDPAQDSNPLPNVLSVNTTNGTVLFGSLVANVQTANTDASVNAGWQMAPIPEPSAALLGLLGAIGLIRRRR
jgi:hypothetical protein